MAQSQGALALSQSPYTFEGHPVRIFVRDGEPWFAAADVCRVLKLTNSRMALKALDDDEKGVSSTDTLGGPQTVAIISRPGLDTLVLRCRDAIKPGTLPHRFRRWVTHEVLPSIRRTGMYAAPARVTLAQTMAAEVAAIAYRTVLQAVLAGAEDIEGSRWTFGLRQAPSGRGEQGYEPWASALPRGAIIGTLDRLAEMIATPNGLTPTDADLVKLGRACLDRLNQHISHRAQR
ncbi:BRO family protein [Achromobacter sp. HNDS-1]|uniref:BRO family protein n=1 Tax=Achromobacter sp. HNDS-1 TaxID=3151598 RepID=A0AAU7LEE5_9BURK